MPNLCEGTLKVRGKQVDLINFIKNGLQPMGTDIVENYEMSPRSHRYVNMYCDGSCHIKNTYRGFVDSLDVEFDNKNNQKKSIIILHTRFAWNVIAEQLLKICKAYNIDMNIYAYERGVEFNRHIKIVDGKIIHNDEIRFKDYIWECPEPELGG